MFGTKRSSKYLLLYSTKESKSYRFWNNMVNKWCHVLFLSELSLKVKVLNDIFCTLEDHIQPKISSFTNNITNTWVNILLATKLGHYCQTVFNTWRLACILTKYPCGSSLWLILAHRKKTVCIIIQWNQIRSIVLLLAQMLHHTFSWEEKLHAHQDVNLMNSRPLELLRWLICKTCKQWTESHLYTSDLKKINEKVSYKCRVIYQQKNKNMQYLLCISWVWMTSVKLYCYLSNYYWLLWQNTHLCD